MNKRNLFVQWLGARKNENENENETTNLVHMHRNEKSSSGNWLWTRTEQKFAEKNPLNDILAYRLRIHVVYV